jgi:hypothetical protein
VSKYFKLTYESFLQPAATKFTNLVLSTAAVPAVRYSLIIVIVLRVFLSAWAMITLAASPLPLANQESVKRFFLDEPPILDGLSGALLGPWQRHDSLHYLNIGLNGYAEVEDSVFPPLYPSLIRGLGWLITVISGGEWLAETGSDSLSYKAGLAAGIMISNIALIGLLILLYHVTKAEITQEAAKRTLVYFVLFPTGFFLLAAYSESLFLLFALGAIWCARQGRFWLAGSLGLLATLTRNTGIVLVLPLAYEYARQRNFDWQRVDWQVISPVIPAGGMALFLAWREWQGLPAISAVYETYWFQTTAFPGRDVITALELIFSGISPFRLVFDFFIILFLGAGTVAVFRRLPAAYGLYCLMALLLILLPYSRDKPLYSYSRYATAFLPVFMVLGEVGGRPWVNRLIIYPSIAFYLYLSGQFFIGGWVA